MGMMANKSPVIIVKPRRAGPVLVCKKCLRRAEGGGKLKRRLKSELKRRSSSQKTRRPRLVLANCFGICPKRAVVLASAHTLGRGEFILLSDSAGGSIEDAARVLMSVGQERAHWTSGMPSRPMPGSFKAGRRMSSPSTPPKKFNSIPSIQPTVRPR
jgi:hypothetical protein